MTNLESYIALQYFGDKTVADVLNEAELAANLPPDLIREWLKSGDADEIDAETLAWLEQLTVGDE
jgi:hypothetical protein